MYRVRFELATSVSKMNRHDGGGNSDVAHMNIGIERNDYEDFDSVIQDLCVFIKYAVGVVDTDFIDHDEENPA